MNLEELMRDLPWGLHDAHLVRMTVDYDTRTASVDVRLQIAERQTTDQLARLQFTGLESFAALPMKGPLERENDLPWIDQLHEGPELEALRAQLPDLSAGCSLSAFYVRGTWQRFAVCARDVTLTWIEPAPVPSRSGLRSALTL
jgi:hypothetical protein